MSESSVNRVSGEQYKIVEELLCRQDDVLEQLDALDDQVEAAIKQFVGKTEDSEQDIALEEVDVLSSESILVDSQTVPSADPSIDVAAKAA